MATGTRIIVSGMRPTGRLHLGNLHGALVNWSPCSRIRRTAASTSPPTGMP